MSNSWKKVKLFELAKIEMGSSPPSKYYNEDGIGTPFIQGVAEFTSKYPIIKKFTTKITKKADKGDILMSVRAPVGDLNISTRNICIGRGLCSLKSKESQEFLYFLLKNNQEYIQSYSNGAIYQSINKEQIMNLTFKIPESLLEQRKIATILSNYDDLIENNIKRIELLEKTAKLIYDEWFVKFKFPGYEKVKMVDSELGKIPEGWEVKRLKDLGEFKNGINYGKKDSGDTKYKIVNVKQLANQDFIISEDLNDVFIDKKKARAYLLTTDDLLIVRSASPGEVGFIIDNGNVIFSGFCIRFRFYKVELKNFLYYKFKELKYQLTNFSNGATLNNINQEILNKIKIVLPNEQLIEEFNNLIRPIFKLLSNLLFKNKNLHEIRDLLLPKLINGLIDVSELDIKVPEVEA